MPLESVTHISDLVVTNPTSTDPKSEGDNHLRNIKIALKTDFPNISGPVTKTHTQLNNALDKTGDTMTGPLAQAAGTAALPSYTFSGDTNTGIYSPGADRVGIATAGAQRVEVDASGNVGVGITPSAWGTGTSQRAVELNAAYLWSFGSAVAEVGTNNYYNASNQNIYKTSQFATAYRQRADNGEHQWLMAPAGTAGNVATFVTVMRIDASGNVLVTGSGGLGYGGGSGGTATQPTSKSTTVALNKPSGTITMNAAALAAGATVSFTFSSTSIGLNDIVDVQVVGGAAARGTYQVWTDSSGLGAGSTMVFVKNISAGSLSEALVLSFSLGKVATS